MPAKNPHDASHSCRLCGCGAGKRCRLPGLNPVACHLVADDLCSACSPDAAPGWVHPSAQAIEMDLEIAALLDHLTYGLSWPGQCPIRA